MFGPYDAYTYYAYVSTIQPLDYFLPDKKNKKNEIPDLNKTTQPTPFVTHWDQKYISLEFITGDLNCAVRQYRLSYSSLQIETHLSIDV